MVLSLVNLALISITDGIKNGTIQNPYMLPPMLRQRVLNTAIKRGILDDPYWVAHLNLILNDTKSISIQIDGSYTTEFFQRLRDSMTVTLPNEERVEAAVTKLFLREFCFIITIYNKSTVCWKRVLENWAKNCVELSIRNTLGILGNGCHPHINFKQLTTLKLDNCGIDRYLWPEFLHKIPTLEYLHLIHVTVERALDSSVLDQLLPFSMPRLKLLEISGKYQGQLRQRFNCNKAFVDKLMGCPKLGRVYLMLDESSTDETSLIQLSSLNITIKIKARFVLMGYGNADNAAAFDSSSKFNVVRIFHEMIDSIGLFPWGKWKPQFLTALDDVVTTCLYLTSFHFDIHNLYRWTYRPAEPVSKEDTKRINAALVRFFGNSERALQLKDLCLHGNFDEAVVSAVFENCLNLVQLKITYCPALHDQHLIDWVSRAGPLDGRKLSEFSLTNCKNVTSEGIIPILERSAEDLLRYHISVGERSGGGDWRAVLKNHCPNAQPGQWEY